MKKHIPMVGEKLSTYTPCGNMWVSSVRRPWTVEQVISENKIVVRQAKPVFNGPVYYDTLPDDIVDDLNGERMVMRYNNKRNRWQESPAGSYPRVAIFCGWDWQPYLD